MRLSNTPSGTLPKPTPTRVAWRGNYGSTRGRGVANLKPGFEVGSLVFGKCSWACRKASALGVYERRTLPTSNLALRLVVRSFGGAVWTCCTGTVRWMTQFIATWCGMLSRLPCAISNPSPPVSMLPRGPRQGTPRGRRTFLHCCGPTLKWAREREGVGAGDKVPSDAY